MRPAPFRSLCLALAICLAAPLAALTAEELTAIHDRRGEPYELVSTVIDDATRARFEADMARRDPELRAGVMAALEGRFDGAVIHLYRQTDTSLRSYIVALEVGGEIVLVNIHSVAFFENSDIVARRMALFDAVTDAMAPDNRFGRGWTERSFGAAAQAARDYADGTAEGPYPGAVHATQGGVQSYALALVPDWIDVTVTALDCAPRYPIDGWALLFLCP